MHMCGCSSVCGKQVVRGVDSSADTTRHKSGTQELQERMRQDAAAVSTHHLEDMTDINRGRGGKARLVRPDTHPALTAATATT